MENPKFRDQALMEPAIRKRLCLVVINEIFYIEQWGKGFRRSSLN